VQQHAEDPLPPRLECDDVLAGREHDTADRHHALLCNCVADDAERLLADLAVGNDVVGAVDVEIVNLGARHELGDIDGARRLDLDRLEA
jgi:hypothetical protein